MSKFYITAAIPYVNAKSHVGHALEFVQTDVIARYHKILGDETLMLSGGDENALKNVQAAEKEGVPVQEFVDKNTALFFEAAKKLNVNFDVFQKGSDAKHHSSSQTLWKRCAKNGDIYKKEYSGLYCVGCELFYEQEELSEKGECFEHPGKPLEKVTEENYFFRLSKYQAQIQQLIESDTLKIYPQKRKNEALAFVKQGLEDISISRSNERAKNWGVPVPNDPTQRMYVWFDALNIYQSGVGFDWNKDLYKKWWPADLHVIGKGILRFHAIYWPAFLLSAGLRTPKSLFVHGYFTVDGQKMSKTLGNVIDPVMLVEKYGVDAIRYYLLREIPSTEDGDFSERRLKEIYNADLANGVGNLAARVAKLCEKNQVIIHSETSSSHHSGPLRQSFSEASNLAKPEHPESDSGQARMTTSEHLKNFEFNLALEKIWKDIKNLDVKINADKPWSKSKEEATPLLREYVSHIRNIAYILKVFLPQTSEKIENQFKGPNIVSQKPLFPRII